MTTDLHYLALTALVTALMWIPYGTSMIVDQGLLAAVGNRDRSRRHRRYQRHRQRIPRAPIRGAESGDQLRLCADWRGADR